MKKLLYLTLFVSLALSGCAAIQTSSEYSELDVKGATERPVFTRTSPNNLFLNVDCPVIEFAGLQDELAARYAQRGYSLVHSPEQADLILNIMIRNQEMTQYSARAAQGRRDPTTGASAALGVGSGYLASGGDPVSTVAGGAAGLLLGGIADVTLNSWVYLGTIDVYANILAQERNPGQNDLFRETETRVVVRAKQADLEWDSSAHQIKVKLVDELALVLPARK